MSEKMSRRKLLEKSSQAIVAGGLGVYGMSVVPAEASSTRKGAAKGVDYYEKLGVETFINAAGTYTILTASTMPERGEAACSPGAEKAVPLFEVHETGGKYLGEKLDWGGGLVTSGASAG